MRRTVVLSLLVGLLLPVLASAAHPHWSNCPIASVNDTLTVEGRIAGLGNKHTTPLEVAITGTALCVDLSVPVIVASQPLDTVIGIEPAKGHVTFTIDLTPVFDPACEEPFDIVFADVTACETTNTDIGCCPEE